LLLGGTLGGFMFMFPPRLLPSLSSWLFCFFFVQKFSFLHDLKRVVDWSFERKRLTSARIGALYALLEMNSSIRIAIVSAISFEIMMCNDACWIWWKWKDMESTTYLWNTKHNRVSFFTFLKKGSRQVRSLFKMSVLRDSGGKEGRKEGRKGRFLVDFNDFLSYPWGLLLHSKILILCMKVFDNFNTTGVSVPKRSSLWCARGSSCFGDVWLQQVFSLCFHERVGGGLQHHVGLQTEEISNKQGFLQIGRC